MNASVKSRALISQAAVGHVPVPNVERVRIDEDRWLAIGELADELPVCRGAATVKQAGGQPGSSPGAHRRCPTALPGQTADVADERWLSGRLLAAQHRTR
jgi:hypothetical protein